MEMLMRLIIMTLNIIEDNDDSNIIEDAEDDFLSDEYICDTSHIESSKLTPKILVLPNKHDNWLVQANLSSAVVPSLG
jgi:hypothetical protein